MTKEHYQYIMVAALMATTLVAGAQAAEITLNDNTLNIVGNIEHGDADVVAEYVGNFDAIVLNSTDGSFNEVVEIVKLVIDDDISTVSQNCTDECTYIWLAGDTKLIADNAPVLIQPDGEIFEGADLPMMAVVGWLFAKYDMPIGSAWAIGWLGQGKEETLILTPEVMMDRWQVEVGFAPTDVAVN